MREREHPLAGFHPQPDHTAVVRGLEQGHHDLVGRIIPHLRPAPSAVVDARRVAVAHPPRAQAQRVQRQGVGRRQPHLHVFEICTVVPAAQLPEADDNGFHRQLRRRIQVQFADRADENIELLNTIIKPRKGMLVAFTAGFYHEHAVLRVAGRQRLTMPFFLTFDKDRADPSLL